MQKHLQIVLSVAIIACFSYQAQAQVVKVDSLSEWKKAFKAGLNLNQASFTSNWKAGGVNSFGFNALLNYKANYKSGNKSWDNEIDMLFGMVNNAGQGYRKTLDRIFIDTRYGQAMSSKWDLIVAANLVTQFAKGYKYVKDANGLEQGVLISDTFAPAFVTLNLGAEWHPNDFFKVRFSPIAPRVTLLPKNDGRYAAVDSIKPYGVEVGKTARFEWYAFQMIAEFNKDIATNINLKWRYMMFADYQSLEANKVDHRVDLNLTAKVNKFINVTVGGIFIYDFDQDISPQYSQAFSLGVLYTFQNYKDK